ncbi:MAG: hypothetical protein Q8Q67_02180 [bacterium]|nr:hypothetical protein [bacterium]
MRSESSVLANRVRPSEESLEAEQKERSIAEKESVMTAFCAERGNPISIVESGKEMVVTSLKPEFEDVPDLAIKGVIQNALVAVNQFLSSPTFTDTFHENHGLRREWERTNKYEMEEDVAAYYESNRLGLNVLSQASNIVYILNDPDYSHNFTPETLDKLSALSEKVHQVIPDNLQSYANLSDKEKQKLIPGIEEINRDLLSILATESKN